MAGAKVKRLRHERVHALMQDDDFVQEVLAQLAGGVSLVLIAEDAGLPYGPFYRVLTERHAEAVKAARKAHANQLVETMLSNADKVDANQMNPKAVSVSSGIRQWAAARYDRDAYGERSTVDMRVQGSVELHVAAIRALTEEGDDIDGEYVEIGQVEADEDAHPLL